MQKKSSVKLVSKTDNAIKVAFTAIRTCYSPNEFEHIWSEEYDEYKEKNEDHIRLIKQIVSHGHTSTLEHVNFTFSLQGVSRAFLAQFSRHRHISMSVQSQRYVRLESGSRRSGFDYYIPESVFGDSEKEKLYINTMKKIQESYDSLRELGLKAEDARYVLPNSTNTNLVTTMSLRSLIEMYSKRNKNTHSQKEIQDIVEEMVMLVIESEPWVENVFVELFDYKKKER